MVLKVVMCALLNWHAMRFRRAHDELILVVCFPDLEPGVTNLGVNQGFRRKHFFSFKKEHTYTSHPQLIDAPEEGEAQA